MHSTTALRLASCLLLLILSPAAGAAAPDPLFQSDEPLRFAIAGPFATLMRERPDDEELDGTAAWTEADGTPVEVSVQLRTRGNFRRDSGNCPFAPLRLDFRGSEVEGTLLDGQDKLKLVTHCRDRSSRYEQLVLREYLTYRMLNTVTDLSYRVRLLQITYHDTDGVRNDVETWAFLIEHKDRFDNRTGLEALDIERVSLSELDPAFSNLIAVFQYLIGNTDYSPIAAAEGVSCCHNTHPYARDGGAVHSIPYDFDMSGMVDAPYAVPNPRFRLRSVRDRQYRGRCRFIDHLPASLERFQAARETLYSLVADEPLLTASSRRGLKSFLDSFYRTIDNERAVDRRLSGECVGQR